MKARILDSQLFVYSEPDLNSQPVAQVFAGQDVDLGSFKKKGDKGWVKVKLATGQEGYLVGNAKVFLYRLVTLLQKSVKVYGSPSLASMPRAEFKKNDKFYLVEVVKQDDKDWVRVRDSKGTEGFIEGNTKIKQIPMITKDAGKKNMLYGALWFIGGVVVTIGTLSSSSGSGIIAWGAILFGGIQFVQGLIQFLTTKD
jgi:uncharacterized protein YgiM (DUF1202 family)